MEDKSYVLADDLELIERQLRQFPGYSFAGDFSARMQALGLSQSALAAQACVSHAAVGKWLNKGAKPHGKERLKELGMALGMEEGPLNAFLCANGYPRLYAKNPLDIACRFILGVSAGETHVVSLYWDFLWLYRLDSYALSGDPVDISTAALSRELGEVKSVGSLEAWLAENGRHFRALGKAYIPHAELIHFVLLYLGTLSVHELYVAGELPVSVRNLLYPLIADQEVAVRGLRAKLIVFGLYENMNEDEIDTMLNIAKLPPITEPSARVDQALLTAIRCAHERYPYYELENAAKVLESLGENELPDLRARYLEQQRRAAELVDYYEADAHKSRLDELFEQHYTGYADKGMLHYLHDILTLLVANGVLREEETAEYTALMQTYSKAALK